MSLTKLKTSVHASWQRAVSYVGHLQENPKRSLPAVSAFLVALLLVDTGFILLRTSVPNASVVQASVLHSTQNTLAKPTAKPQQWVQATPTAVALQTNQAEPTPFPTTAVQAPLTQDVLTKADFVPTPSACTKPTGQLITDTVDSKVLQASLPVHVYLPPCYKKENAYPVLYLIQGSNHEFGGWVEFGVPRIADMQMSLGMLPPFIIVMPASGQRAPRDMYADSLSGQGSWEDFFVHELMPKIEKTYSVWRSREGRAIGGISRGGYWSIQIAFAHPDLFSVLGGHSPSITDKLIGVPANFSMLSWAASPDELRSMRIWLDAGSRDWAQRDIKKLSGDLDNVKIGYQMSVGDGAHEDDYWTSRIAEYLAFYASTWPRIAKDADNAGIVSDASAGDAPSGNAPRSP